MLQSDLNNVQNLNTLKFQIDLTEYRKACYRKKESEIKDTLKDDSIMKHIRVTVKQY